MSSEKLSTFCHPGIHSASKSCRKPVVNRLCASTSKLNRLNSVNKTTLSCKSSGEVDEEYFIKAFNDVPSLHISSEEIFIVFEEIRNNICTKDNWEKRVEAMKTLRAVIVAYSNKHDSILQQVNLLDVPLESSLKDLKSHVVREACITVAFLSVNLQHKFHRFAEVVFTALMSLIQSSVKVISSSGAMCIRFILRSTHNPRLIPMLIHYINSKSASLRCAVCEFINLILNHWKTKLLERHLTILKDTIKMGTSDANPDARAFSRQAFWRFVSHFPGQEKIFLNSLDASYRRFMYSGMVRSVSSLNNSVSCVDHGRPLSSEASISKVHNSDMNKINQGKSTNFNSSEIRKKEKCLTYSDVTKQNLKENKFSEPLNTGTNVNSRSGCLNEKITLNTSNISIRPKIKTQNTEVVSRYSSQSTVNTPQLNILSNENCTDNNERIPQYQCANDKSSVNDNVRKIIMNLSSTSLKNKVEGLVDLQIFFQSGNTLDFNDLKFVTDEMTNMLEKDSTDYFGLLLDTLGELIVCHKKDLNYWLDLFLMHVLNKFSVIVPKHFENRLAKVLDIIRESFPVELQLLSLLRFFKENAQEENIKAIAVALNYIYILISIMESGSEFATTYIKNESNIIIPVLIKITIYAVSENGSTNHSELQKAAIEALLKLYNLNIPLIKVSFSQLPEKYQKVFQNIICGKINNTDINGNNSSSSLFPSLNVKSSINHFSDSKTIIKSGEILQQPQVTTTDIQDFGCDLCKQDQLNNIRPVKSVTSEKVKNVNNLKERHLKSESGLCNKNQCSVFINQTHPIPHYFNTSNTNSQCTSLNDVVSSCDTTNHENALICTVLKSLNTKTEHEADKCPSLSDKITALNELIRLTGETSSFAVRKNFKLVLRTLFDYMSGTDMTCIILALQVLAKMLNRKDITEKFNNFTELLIFRLLMLCENKNTEISENAVVCVNTIAVALDPDSVLRITVPLALTLRFPANVAAIDMITTLIKIKGREPIVMYIPDLMPTLVKGLDSMEISLRKSALFCIVALYLGVGKEPLRQYLTSLDHGKLRLLMIYIQKSKEKQQCLKT